MKKRFLSGFLAVVMCLSLLPATAWADGVDAGETVTAESGTGTAESGGASSGGADQWESPLVGMTISGAVWSGGRTMIMAMDGDAMSGGERDRSRIFEALVSAPTDDYGGPVTFYFPEDNASSNPTRRVSFFCNRQLDASKIVLGQGATLVGSFQETVLGSGTGAIYLYQGLVTFHMFQAMFYYGEGEQADIVGGNADVEQLAMVYTYVLPEADAGTAYVGEVFVTAANGDELTVEISGVNLPDGAAGSLYSIRNDPSYVDVVQSGEGAVIYTCEGYDQAASDPDHGVYAYTMTPTGATPQDSWFPLYIGEEQARFYGNNNETVTLPTLAPMSAVSSGGGAGSLSVSVPARVTTTSGSAAIPITNNGYTQMRYKVDAAFTAEDATAWTAIPASVTVNVGTTAGRHTVYFQFRDGSGHSDSASTTVYQQSSARLPAPAEVGLLSGNKIVSPDENNVYHLINGATYTMWAKLEGGQDKERDVVVSWTGHSFTLGWDGTNDRYEKAVTFNSGQATDTLTFRAKQLDNDATPHDSAQLGVSVTTLPGVYMGWVPYIQASYEDGAYLVKPGQSIRWSFTGDVETSYSGYAKLTYKDGSGTEKTAVSVQDSESGGYYSGTVNIPSDAAELVNITYYLATSENPETTGRTKVYSLLQYKVGIPLKFELGTDYADATVEITRTANGSSQDYYRYGWVDSAGKATLDGVSWGDGVTYTYTITGHSGQIKTGTLTQGKNTYTKGELSLPTLHTVTVGLSTTITGNRSSYWGIYPKLFWRLGNENERGVNLTVNSNHASDDSATVDHIPEGAVVRVGATVNNDGIRAITRTVDGLTSTGDLTATVGDSNGVITVDAELFETDTSTITGTLLKPDNSTPLGWAGVTVRQEADTGAGANGILNARHLSAYRYGNADGNGSFSVGAPLTGFKAEVTVRAQNYQTVVKEVDSVASGTNSLGSIKMEYQDKLVVTPILSVEPLRDQYGNALSYGSAQGDTSLLVPAGMWRTSRPGDDSNLSYSSESLGDGQTKYFFSSNSTNVQPGDEIRVYFHELSQDSGLVLAGNRESADNTYRGLRYVDGTLDSKRNMTITVNAQHLGEVRATVVPESAGGDYIGRLLVYSSWGQYYATLAGQAAGRGELKVSGLPAGQYTVVTVMYTREKADLVSSLIERGRLHSALSNSSTYSTYYADAVRELRVTENVRVVNGQVNSLGTLTPEKALDRAVLGDYVIRSSVTQIKPDGTSQVNVWIEPDPSVLDPRPLTEVQVLRGDGGGALQASWKSAAFSDSSQYGDDGYQYTSSAAVNFKVNDQQTVLRLSYTVKPKDQETEIRSQVSIQYQPGNRWSDYYNTGTASLSIRESVERFELSVPERVLRAVTMQTGSLNEVDENKSDAWTVPVTIFASPREGGSVVTVYDNGVAVGTFRVTEVTTEVTVNLTRPYEFGLHELYATRPAAHNSDAAATTKSYVTVADRSREINVSHYIWWHHNDRGLQQWNYKTLDELARKTIRYWPSKNSAFAFAIENAREDELANVTFNTAYKGTSPDKTWGAAPISKERFKAYWTAKGAAWNENDFNENTSFWVVDAGSDQKARGETVSSQIDPATMRVDEHGFNAGYFDSFNVNYHYLGGTNVDLLAVALLPTDPTDIEKLTSEDIKTLLSVIDTASDGLTAVGLENYYSVMGGSLHTFADREGGNRASVLADAKNSGAANHEKALKDFKENLLLANVDSLPADLRDAINASYTDPNTNKVTSTVMDDDAKAEAAENTGETVYDGYKVEIDVGEGAKAIKKMESAVTWSSVKIPDVNLGRFKTAADGTRSAVQEGDAAYIDPNSSDAVEWLMNYELDKKDHGTPEEKEKYKDVTWTSYESAQGTVYERQEVKYTKQEDNTYKIETELSSYLPKVAVKAMLGDTQYDSMVARASAPFALLRNAPLVTSAGKLTGDMLAAGGSNLVAATWQTTADQDKGVERLQTVNTVYSTLNTVEDAREAIKVSHTYADLSKGTAQTWAGGERLTQASAGGKALGQGLNILGAITTAYDIKKGPQGKNEDLLYEALNLVKDPKDRQQFSESIAHYSEFKNEIYGTDCAVGATTAGLSFAPAPVSAVSTIAGLKYSQNSSAAKADLSAEYDGILNAIAQTLRVQDAREVYQGKQDAALAALTSRLEREGFAGAQLQAELSKFTLTKDATGAFGYEPVEGWGQAVGVDPTKLYGYVPEQPDLNKFEIDYGPSFGGKVPTQAELDAFYGSTDGFTTKMEEDKRTSTSLEDLINKVENDLKTSDGKPLFDIEFNSTFSLDEAFPSFKLYIDPSGYAFEGVEEDRVAGVEATILQGDGNDIDSTTAYTAWVDTNEAVEERQANPQYTAALDADNPDAGGRYGWMTPSGVWKVRFRGVTASDGNGNKNTSEYQTTETKPMEVPPEHTAVNIGLLSTAAPKVAKQTEPAENKPNYSADDTNTDGINEDHLLSAYVNQMTVQFDKWMQLESLVDVTPDGVSGGDESFGSDTAFLAVTDADGNLVSGTFAFPDKTANTGYKASYTVDGETVENLYQTDYIGSDWFVKTVIFTPESAFDPTKKYTVTVSKTALSYAGVALSETADFTATVQPSEKSAPLVFNVTFVYGDGRPNTTGVTAADGTVTLPTPTRDGYTLQGWYTEASGGSPVPGDTVFTQDTTLYARWAKSGGSSSSGGGSGASAPVSTTSKSEDTVSASTIDRLISEKKELTITGDNKATAIFSTDALKGIDKATSAAVTVKLEDVSDDYAETYPDGEVYSLDVSAGSREITDFGGDVTVTLPHERGEDETNPKRIAVFALNEDGTVGERLDTDFDEKVGTVTFTTDEAGAFLIDYIPFPFEDVREDTYYYDAADWAEWNGITTGKTEKVFDPLGNASRAEVVTFLWRCAGSPEPKAKRSEFADVSDDAWYVKAVLWAAEQDITKGTGEGNFSPAMTVTRDQFVTLLYRMEGTAPTGANPFTDVKREDYYYEAVLWASKSGVTNGTGGTLFSPDWYCDRGQVVTMLYRWFGKE